MLMYFFLIKIIRILVVCVFFLGCAWGVAMAPFLRIAFNAYDLGTFSPMAEAPFCAVKMKEALCTGE